MPDLSVIIINYNQFQMTIDCINSILEKTHDIRVEIILVDNHSDKINPDDFLKIFPTQIKLIKSQENGGFAKGNNLGIQQASGEYIVLLNNDTLLQNNAFLSTKLFLESQQDVAIATGKLIYPNGQIQHNCQRFPSVKYKLAELFRIQKLVGKKRAGTLLFGSFFDHNTIAYPDWVWGTYFMFRKSFLTEFEEHKLPETFFMYCEDMEWCMETKKKGYKIGFEPKGEVIHLLGASGAKKNQLMEENLDKFKKMYYSSFSRFIVKTIDRLLS